MKAEKDDRRPGTDSTGGESAEHKGGKKKILAIIILAVAVVVIIGVAVYLIRQENNSKKMESVKETVDTSEDTDENELDIDWQELQATNKDIYAWIYIPGTEVNYPVLQSDEYTDTDYYLDHNLDGTTGLPGCIYTQKLNAKDFEDPVTVIYGHDMKNGTMFRSLHDYMDRDFFDENNYIYIYTPDTTYTYQIYAAYRSDNALILGKYGLFQDSDVYAGFLDEVVSQEETEELCHIDTSVTVSSQDKTIILSTCIGNDDYRYLVQAKQIKAKEHE
jgi:sortase B